MGGFHERRWRPGHAYVACIITVSASTHAIFMRLARAVGSSARVGSFGAALVLASAAEARVGGEIARNRLCHSGRK